MKRLFALLLITSAAYADPPPNVISSDEFGNTAGGTAAMQASLPGYADNGFANDNTGLGNLSLLYLTKGSSNTAVGSLSMSGTTTGNGNTGVGTASLLGNTTGTSNTAVGVGALQTATTGSNNIAVGANAGYRTNGSNNIVIGHVGGVGDNNVIHIGSAQTAAYMAGIAGKKLSGSIVVVTGAGQLGVAATDPIAALQAQITAQAALIKTLQAQVATLLKR